MIEIDLKEYSRIVVLTGAGVSVASGIRPFRGPSGVWNEISADKLNADAAKNDPEFVWQVFGSMREVISRASPNAAHKTLARVEEALSPNRQLTLITQNVDGLHQQAGSTNVVELHGSLLHTRCSNSACDSAVFADTATYTNGVPRCEKCQSHLLPNVVLFDEPIPVEAEWQCKRALRDCDLFLAVGTSGTVSPASNFVRSADYAGAKTVLINLEKPATANPYFHEEIIGPAEQVLPDILRA